MAYSEGRCWMEEASVLSGLKVRASASFATGCSLGTGGRQGGAGRGSRGAAGLGPAPGLGEVDVGLLVGHARPRLFGPVALVAVLLSPFIVAPTPVEVLLLLGLG